MKLTEAELRARLDAVAGPAGAAHADRDGVERRADGIRRRRRRAAALATATCLVVAGGALVTWTRDADVAVTAGPATATTTPNAATQTLVQRSTPLGELVVTLGPATQPWSFDPYGPSDRWREPARCYLPRLTVDVGGRTTTAGVSRTDAPLVLPLPLRSDAEPSRTVVAVAVLGAIDGRTYRLATAGGSDETTASRSVAVLVRPSDVRTDEVNASVWNDLAITEVDPSGSTRPIPLDLATAEHAFYAGDVNNCPGHTGVSPRPTVPAPADVADASAVAARALDPATPAADALALFDHGADLAAQLDAFRQRLAAQATALHEHAIHVVPDASRTPVFHSTGDGWISVTLAGSDGTFFPTTWAKVERHAAGWKVDPRSVCAAFTKLALTGAPRSCAD